jgi:hypothetical protein
MTAGQAPQPRDATLGIGFDVEPARGLVAV